MILPRCVVVVLLLATILAERPAAAQNVSLATDERGARLIARYKSMLAANPVEGMALDRLWQAASDQGQTAALLDEYRRAAQAQPPNLAALLVEGLLLQKAGRLDESQAAFTQAVALEPGNALPRLALGDLAAARSQPRAAAAAYAAAVAKMPPADRRLPDVLLKLGNAWLAANEPSLAADAWERIVALNPTDVSLHQRLAENYEKNHLPERSIAHYEWIEQHAQPEQKAGAWRALARLHEARGEIDAAGTALERGLALTARDNWLHGELEQSLIRLYERAGRIAELAARWRGEVAKSPRDLDAYLRLAHLAADEGDTTAQRSWLEQIVALAPQDRADTLALARLSADAGERERAAALYDGLLQSQPANLALVLARAELDLQLDHAPAAVERIEACVALHPADESVTTPALQFFLSHHLDAAAERRLQADAARQPQADEPALALANFYFGRRREPEARAALDALLRQPAESAQKIARLLRVADCYLTEHLLDDALRCWRQAAELDPGATAPWLAAADALASQEQTAAAQDAFEHALKVAADPAEHVEIEHKLFDLLQTAQTRVAAAPGARDRLEQYLAQLAATAQATPSPDAWLRLARWQFWNHDATAAAATADKVITLDPRNIAARELQVSIAGETHQRDLAEQRLREIMTLDPARNLACRRQIAELKMEDGSSDEAIALYRALQQDQPGSIPALTDLALAQQRVDRWYDALTTWERAYALPGATAKERADVRRPMLIALDRLGQYPRGAEILQAAIDEQSDLATKEGLFRELAAYCQQHDLSGQLQQQYNARLAAQPADYFTLTALATLAKAAGHDREAYRLLRQADFSAPDPVHSLQELATAAEGLGETGEAVSWERRLLALPGQDTAENLEKLAALQDEGLATDDAAQTWEQAVARFPRETDVLDRAADFFVKARRPGRARELLGQLVALDPTGLKRLFQLGELDLAAEDRAGARTCFEHVLDRSDAEKPGQPFLLPAELKASAPRPDPAFDAAVARFRTRFGVAEPAREPPAPPEDDRQWRLAAIRELARLLFAPAAAQPPGQKPAAPLGTERDRQQWRERWKTAAAGGARSEPLWAFYFAGDRTLTLDTLAGWMKNSPQDEAYQDAFTAAGLHLGAYRVLAHWAWDETDRARAAANGQRLVASLLGYLEDGGKPEPGMVAELFPPQVTVRELLWKAAEDGFAAQDRYAEAVELGERVVTMAESARADFSLPVAQWELYLGHVEAARSVLRAALEEGGGESFETSTNPVFAVLREYFLLLPENERAGFADEYLRRLGQRGGPAPAVLSVVLLHGLAGEWDAAFAATDQLLALRMLAADPSASNSADLRRWTYLLNNGLQLQDWGLEPVAVHLWRGALRTTSAFERQDGQTLSVREDIRTRLLGLQVTLAPDPAKARQELEDYLRSQPQPGSVAQLAAQFRESAQWAAATLLDEYLIRVEPGDVEHWRDLFAAFQASGDNAACDQALTTLLAGTQPLPTGLSRVDLVCHEAGLREDAGDGTGARHLLARALTADPHSVPLLAQLAGSYQLAGQPDPAAAIWRQALPFDLAGHAALALVALELKRGHRPEAIAVLKERLRHVPGDLQSTVELGRLYAAAGQTNDMSALAAERLQAGDLNALIHLATAVADKPAREVLRGVLAEAVRRAREPAERFRAELGLLDLYRLPQGDDAAFALEMRRLERIAGMNPALHAQFVDERFAIARERGAKVWLEGELQRAWRAGDGEVVTGEMLVRLYLEEDRAEDLRRVVAEIDSHADLPELPLFAVEQDLSSSKYASLALPVAQRLTRRFPQKEAYALARARTCWQAGRPEEARGLLEALDLTFVFRPNIADQISDLYRALGDRAGAREFLTRSVARDPFALRSPQMYLHLAQADIEDKQYDAARRLLLVAYRNPAATDLAPLTGYLAATARLSPDVANRLPGAEFPLDAAGRARLLTAICDQLEKAGQAADARRLALAHPELWSAAPGVVDYLCAQVGADDWPGLAAALEDALRQTSAPSRSLARSLAGVYVRWAAAERPSPGRAPAALLHLARAHELLPDDFSTARLLAEAYLQKKQTGRAAEALRDFLTPAAFPEERAQAQQVLARK